MLNGQLTFGQNPHSKVSIELSISHPGKIPHINDCSSLNKANVIIRNNSEDTLYFYEDWNSYGYYNISFEIKTKDSIYEVVRPPKLWYRNFKSHYILNPKESLVFSYPLVDTACTSKWRKSHIFENGWTGFPAIHDTVEIRTIYQLCHLEDSVPYESIERLNFRAGDYIDYLDGDIEVFESKPKTQPIKEAKKQKQKPIEPKPVPQSKLNWIFQKVLVSEWQKVIL